MEQLTEEENNLIVEALLFSSCLEITDDWSSECRHSMLQIANKLQTPSTQLKNIELHNFNESDNDITLSICTLFPHINKIQHITPTAHE